VITFSNRQITGAQSFDAARLVEPSDLSTGQEVIVMELTLEAADLVNPAKAFTLAVFASFDAGVTFRKILGASWRGDAGNTVNPIKVGYSAKALLGARLRADIVTNSRMRFSGSILIRQPFADEA
jgi:hypothetical protein